MKKSTLYIIISVLCLSAWSCRDEDGPFEDTFVSYDIAVFTSQDQESGSVFTLYRPDSDEPIEYSASRQFIDVNTVPVGNRLLLGYIPEGAPYVSGKIKIEGYSKINNDTLRVYESGTLEDNDWDRDPIYVYSMWRAGNYLNVHGKVTFTSGQWVLRLGMEEPEFDAHPAVPQVYLIYQMREPAENFQREFYASFDISQLWNESWCRGIDVNVNNSNLKQNIFSFTK